MDAATKSDDVQCQDEVRGQPSFREMLAAKDEEQQKGGAGGRKVGAALVGYEAQMRSQSLGHEAPRTPPWTKDEREQMDNKTEPGDGGEETANEGGPEWDENCDDEEAELVRRSAGAVAFCG